MAATIAGASCDRCEGVTPLSVSVLRVIGGSEDPYNEPYGELRQCAACEAFYCYTRDHDNAIGYEAAEPTLDRLDVDAAVKLATRATAAAERLRAHFAQQPGDPYAEQVVARYDEQLARLSLVIRRMTDGR